jgi:hypothetical protein
MFLDYESNRKGNKHNFCSKECHTLWQREHPPQFSDEWKKAQSERIKRSWEDPIIRKKRMEGIRRYFANLSEEEKKKRTEVCLSPLSRVKASISISKALKRMGLKPKSLFTIGHSVPQEWRDAIRYHIKLHKLAILEVVKQLEKEGYKVAPLHHGFVTPDAVATKDGKLYAIEVEVTGSPHVEKYYDNKYFDDVFWFIYKHPIKLKVEESKLLGGEENSK